VIVQIGFTGKKQVVIINNSALVVKYFLCAQKNLLRKQFTYWAMRGAAEKLSKSHEPGVWAWAE
jgi:hypothetical protein